MKSSNQPKNKRLKMAIKILASAFFVAWLIFKINWQESLAYLKNISLWQIGIYVAIIFLGIFVSSLKWQGLARHKGFKNPLIDFFKLYLTGAFINNFLPSTIGGDVFRAYEIGKKEKRYAEATATVVMDRFTGLLALIVMAPIFFLLNLKAVSGKPAILAINACFVFFLFAFPFFLKLRNISWIKKMLSYLPEKIIIFLKELDGFKNDKVMLVKSMGYSFLFNLIGVGLANLVLFWSLGIEIDILNYLSVIFIISVISSIPVSFGLKEWSYVTFFGLFGMNISAVIVVAILNRFFQALVNVIALPMYLKSKD